MVPAHRDKGRRSLVLGHAQPWLHKLRAFLSVLGIIIGTGAVITLMAFGEGSMQDALDDIRSWERPTSSSAASSRRRIRRPAAARASPFTG